MIDREMRFCYHFLHIVFRPISRVLFGFEVFGGENVPSSGGVLLLSNHVSYADPVFLGAAVDRNLHYMARATLFKPEIVGRFLRGLNAFPVHLGTPDRKAIRNAIRLLQEGKLLLIFPEGTRSVDGSLGEAQPGIGLIAYRANVPVIPVFLDGAQNVLPKGKKRIRLAKTTVHFGKPIDMDHFRKSEPSKEVYTAIGKEVMARISELKNRSGGKIS